MAAIISLVNNDGHTEKDKNEPEDEVMSKGNQPEKNFHHLPRVTEVCLCVSKTEKGRNIMQG